MKDMNQKNKPVILAIFGKSAAGKDTLKNILCESPYFRKMRQWTTRPMRNGETQDKEYHFCSKDDFIKKFLSDTDGMIEAAAYNNWHYGTPESEIQEDIINVGIFGPAAIDCIIEMQDKYDVYYLEVVTPDVLRLKRSLDRDRSDCHEICRRFLADEKDFDTLEYKISEEIPSKRIIFYNGEHLILSSSTTIQQDILDRIRKNK